MNLENPSLEYIVDRVSEVCSLKNIQIEETYIKDNYFSFFTVETESSITSEELDRISEVISFLKPSILKKSETSFLFAIFTTHIKEKVNAEIIKKEEVQEEGYMRKNSFKNLNEVDPCVDYYSVQKRLNPLSIEILEKMKVVETAEFSGKENLITLGNNHLLLQGMTLHLIDSFASLENNEVLAREFFNQINYLIKRLHISFIDFSFVDNKIETTLAFIVDVV